MTDLADFLRARYDEDEQVARGLLNAARMLGAQPDFYGAGGPAAAAYWQHHDPARALSDIDAKRRIIDEHPILSAWKICTRCSDFHNTEPVNHVPGPCPTLRLLALPYADHLDYQPEWAPET